MSLQSTPQAHPTVSRRGKRSSGRACEECNRRKIKCDKKTPNCSLCGRTGQLCLYPRGRRRRHIGPWQQNTSSQSLWKTQTGEDLDPIYMLHPEAPAEALCHGPPRSDAASSLSILGPAGAVQCSEEQDVWFNSENTAGYSPHSRTINFSPHHQGEEGPLPDFFDFGSVLAEPRSTLLDAESIHESSGSPAGSGLVQTHRVLANGLSGIDNTCTPSKYSISLPYSVVDDLIDLFFKTISGFIPLLHRPNFYQKYRVHKPENSKYHHLQIEDALILNGILALSARYSTSPYFANTPRKERAVPFVHQAKSLYQESIQLENPQKPSLALLQGYILLAFYRQICEPAERSWALIGVCCRLAYDLDLNNIDEDIVDVHDKAQWTSADGWSRREELRRAWWLVWELDTFASSVLARPHTIDKSRINVLLPVSDTHWFRNSPLPSVKVRSDSLDVWKSLQDSANQDERAWFLVCSSLMVIIHDKVHGHGHPLSAEDISEFQFSLTCFALLLPPKFQLSTCSLRFDEDNFVGCNWIVSTILMLHSIRLLVRQKALASLISTPEIPATPSTEEDEKFLSRIIREWDPDYISLACPFVAATLIGPSSANISVACDQAAQHSPNGSSRYLEIFKLVLARIGEYWEIGSSVLKLVHLVETRQSFEKRGNIETEELSQLSLLVPRSTKAPPS